MNGCAMTRLRTHNDAPENAHGFERMRSVSAENRNFISEITFFRAASAGWISLPYAADAGSRP